MPIGPPVRCGRDSIARRRPLICPGSLTPPRSRGSPVLSRSGAIVFVVGPLPACTSRPSLPIAPSKLLRGGTAFDGSTRDAGGSRARSDERCEACPGGRLPSDAEGAGYVAALLSARRQLCCRMTGVRSPGRHREQCATATRCSATARLSDTPGLDTRPPHTPSQSATPSAFCNRGISTRWRFRIPRDSTSSTLAVFVPLPP